jgi:hypothetical protein
MFRVHVDRAVQHWNKKGNKQVAAAHLARLAVYCITNMQYIANRALSAAAGWFVP